MSGIRNVELDDLPSLFVSQDHDDNPSDYDDRVTLIGKKTSQATRIGTHHCAYRNDSEGAWNGLRLWYLIPLHFVTCFAFGLVIFYVVKDRHTDVSDNVARSSNTLMTQSNIMGFISIWLMMIKLILVAWLQLSVWRCSYVLLEKTGLRLQDMSFMVSYGILKGNLIASGSGQPKARRAYFWIVSAILCFSLPAQFVEPLAYSSVRWVPFYVDGAVPLDLKNIYDARPGYSWQWYNMFPSYRSGLVLRAAGMANIVTANSVKHSTSMNSQRVVSSWSTVPINTTLANITVPVFNIESFDWVIDLADLPSGIAASVKDVGFLNISTGNNPMQFDPIEGNAALLKNRPWISHGSTYPTKMLFSGEKYVAVLVERVMGRNCLSITSTFGQLPVPVASLLTIYYDNDATSCFAFAKLIISVGKALCTKCQVVSPMIVEGQPDSIQEDSLVQEVFDVMPEVMYAIVASTNGNTILTNQLENHTRSLLTAAYIGSWSTLTDSFGRGSDVPPLTTQGTQPELVLRAAISTWRMCVFLGLNALVTLCGIALIILQSQCERKPVMDPVLAAIMLDSSDLLKEDRNGLCNATRLSKADHGMGKLWVRRDHDGHFSLFLSSRRSAAGGTAAS